MPETRAEAEERAKRLSFPISHIICLDGDNVCFIVPLGIETKAGRKAYAEARAQGKSKEEAAQIAHYVDKLARG